MIAMQDRTTQGFIAGVAGAVAEMVFTLSMFHGFNLIKFRFLDFASMFTFNHEPQGLFQTMIAEAIVWVFMGSLGAIFSLLIKEMGSLNIIMKGGLYGVIVWLLVYVFVTAFRVEVLYPIDFVTSVIHMIGGVIWGTVMAYVFVYFNARYGVKG
jgi:hypothetical protein